DRVPVRAGGGPPGSEKRRGPRLARCGLSRISDSHRASAGRAASGRERIFLGWFAPRGIVAAAVASVFAIRLDDPEGKLVPATFVVIVGTVVIYGLTAFPVARRLGLAGLNPQGGLVASAHPGARALAAALPGARV